MKTVYLCCTEDKRPIFEAKASVYQKWKLTDRVENADMVAVIRNENPTASMEELIQKAKKLGVEVNYFTESFIRKSIHEALLKGNVKVEKMRSERVRTHGRER